jgi:hypothetical protein
MRKVHEPPIGIATEARTMSSLSSLAVLNNSKQVSSVLNNSKRERIVVTSGAILPQW